MSGGGRRESQRLGGLGERSGRLAVPGPRPSQQARHRRVGREVRSAQNGVLAGILLQATGCPTTTLRTRRVEDAVPDLAAPPVQAGGKIAAQNDRAADADLTTDEEEVLVQPRPSRRPGPVPRLARAARLASLPTSSKREITQPGAASEHRERIELSPAQVGGIADDPALRIGQTGDRQTHPGNCRVE